MDIDAGAVLDTFRPTALPCEVRPGWSRGGRRRWTALMSASALLAAWGVAAALDQPIADQEDAADWARRVVGGLRHGLTLSSHPWVWLGLTVMVILGAVHFLLAALVLRAAAGHRTVPLLPGFLAQLAAAAANRTTPVGLGAAAVNARFLFRRGMPTAGAASTVAAVAVLGSVADALFGGTLWAVGGAVGIRGSRDEVSRLTHVLAAGAARVEHEQRWLVALASVALTGAVVVLWRRPRGRVPRPHSALATSLRQAGDLARRPADLAVLLLASAGTTAVLAVAMVVSVRTVGAGSAAGTGAVLMAYLAGAAAGNLVPMPAGIASTEAALPTGLISAGVPTAHAVPAVILYRAVTFWAPVPAGLLAARSLRRRRFL